MFNWQQLEQAKKVGLKLQTDLVNTIWQTAPAAEAPPRTKLFGVPLDLEETDIPVVIRCSVEFFEQHGVEVEGLFRVSGSASDVKAWIVKLEQGERTFGEDVDVHLVASLLKQYLRDMPEPLVPTANYATFIEAAFTGSDEDLIRALQLALQELPFRCRVIFKYLMQFLTKVSAQSEINKMTPSNIAIVFAPNILRPPGNDIFTQMSDSGHANRVFQALISYNAEIFENEPDAPEPPPLASIPTDPTDLFELPEITPLPQEILVADVSLLAAVPPPLPPGRPSDLAKLAAQSPPT